MDTATMAVLSEIMKRIETLEKQVAELKDAFKEIMHSKEL